MTMPSVTQTVKRAGAGTYAVPSATIAGRTYHVDLTEGSCQCLGHRHRGACAHLEKARARCAEVTAAKARRIPDIEIDELAARWEAKGRADVSEPLYEEIRRRGAEAIRNDALLAIFS